MDIECWMRDRCKGTCSDFCPKLFKLNFLYDKALMSNFQRKHMDLRIDDDNTDLEEFKLLSSIEKDIENFVKDGKNLYIHSANSGNGKTSWSLRLIQAYFNKIWHKCDLECKALYINVPRFLLTLKDNISHESDYVKHIKDNVLLADIVIWDEIGTKCLTQFEFDNLLNIINTRLDMAKSNIYTSNLSEDELQQTVGDRLYSRISNNSINIEFRGCDKRGILNDSTTNA